MSESIDFVDYMIAELERRKAKNQRYSLRAFSRLLGVDSSRLSKILRRERPLSAEMIQDMGAKLNLSTPAVRRYLDHAKISQLQKRQEVVGQEPIHVSLEQLGSISDFRHYWVLELMKLTDFVPKVEYVAKKIQISKELAQVFIDNLQTVGLLKIHDDGTWEDLSHGASTDVISTNVKCAIHVSNQDQVLQLSQEALKKVSMKSRDHSSIMVATNVEKLEAARQMIKAFRRSLAIFLEDTPEKNCLYQTSISLFPLTQLDSNDETIS
ncbi:MAG: TIGR02147 family protein [Bdellovibrio sp.]|nr:TIGR02147 family protein [Bdellovibrio sp.]